MGHTGGLINPRSWRGRCRAGYSNTGGPPLPRKRAPCQKKCDLTKFSIFKLLLVSTVQSKRTLEKKWEKLECLSVESEILNRCVQGSTKDVK